MIKHQNNNISLKMTDNQTTYVSFKIWKYGNAMQQGIWYLYIDWEWVAVCIVCFMDVNKDLASSPSIRWNSVLSHQNWHSHIIIFFILCSLNWRCGLVIYIHFTVMKCCFAKAIQTFFLLPLDITIDCIRFSWISMNIIKSQWDQLVFLFVYLYIWI